MAILSDREIRWLIDDGRLTIDPTPDLDAFAPSTVDLTLASRFRVFNDGENVPALHVAIDADDSSRVMRALNQISRVVTMPDGKPYELEPGGFVLAWTRERIVLPDFLAARVEGRSTLARLGVSVHQSAPTIHPTWDGELQLELTNAGPVTVRLFPGQSICQLVVETMSLPSVDPLRSIHQPQP